MGVCMQVHRRILATLLLCCYTVGSAQAEDTIVEEFIALAEGIYDSRQQMEEDLAAGVEENKRHFRVVRSFARLDAPKVGANVLLSTVEYNTANRWIFDVNEFLVWTLTISQGGNSFRMAPRAFKKQEQRLPYASQPQKLSGISPAALKPAIGGSSCVLEWTRSENGFVGESEPCSVMSTTKGVVLSWNWSMRLTEKAFWVEFNGRDETGASLDGTEGMTPYRLDRTE